MSNVDRETLLVNLADNIEKAEHISGKIIQDYDLNRADASELDDAVFAGNRRNIGIDMEILCDYLNKVSSQLSTLKGYVLS